MKIWAVDVESSNYSWRAYGSTKKEAEAAFKAMWLDWCKPPPGDTGFWNVDRFYWGKDFEDAQAQEITIGACYKDNELYKITGKG